MWASGTERKSKTEKRMKLVHQSQVEEHQPATVEEQGSPKSHEEMVANKIKLAGQTLKTHTPQIRGVMISPPEFGGHG